MANLINLIGKKYGRLTVISLNRRDDRRIYHWNCICDCGAHKIVRGWELRCGNTQSCGCFQLERVTKHGHARLHKPETKEYKCWKNMKSRCLNPGAVGYKNYGGRGIKICDRWLNSYENFFEDVGFAPTDKHSIDRIETNGNYEPGNCRWATKKEQINNQRKSILIKLGDETKSLTEWCRQFNVKYSTAHSRIWTGKMTPEQSILFSIQTKKTGTIPGF